MAKEPNDKATEGSQRQRPKIKLVDFAEGDARPAMAVYAVDRAFKPLHVAFQRWLPRLPSRINVPILPYDVVAARPWRAIGLPHQSRLQSQ